ncbi:LOW QUALITY PROTEIN: ERI1 exoribonuclease 2 [Garra rufa]|uniref:LOW QUALITY PROTEIN: ERI1 exoribonuclease 2 n=1 Tax=Garra rufa TaxID=137080 RepID=UPI003CCE960A
MSTKSLAKELGLIRKRSHSSGADQRSSVCKQRFSFLIIIDFESTCWREKNSSGQEIIEFPAVLLNVSNGEVESEFHSYVQPQERPVLSDFCRELTGITQDQVDSAPPLHICLSRFSRWLQGLQQERGVVFETDSAGPAPSGHPCAFVTWSDWDLGVCLLYECKRKQLSVPEALKSWIDLRATYRLFYNRKPKGLRGALLDLGIQFTGREHSGLVDARNTALLAWRMVCDGCLLTVTKCLRRVSSSALLHTCTGDSTPCTHRSQSGAALSCVKRVSLCLSQALVKSRPPCGNISSERPSALSERNPQQTSVCRSLVSPRTLLSSSRSPLCGSASAPIGNHSYGTLAGLSDTTYDPDTPDTCQQDGDLLTEEEEPGSYDDVLLGAEPEPTQPNETTSVHHKTTRPASSSSGLFKTPKPLPRTDPYGPLSRFLGRSGASFTVYKDPPTMPRPPPPSCAVIGSSSKITAPLCGCGRRARRLTVGNGGPNHGRVFYCCAVRRQSSSRTHKGCDFFKWESGLIQNHLRTPKNTGSRSLR